jgi:HTH-like domain
MQRFGASQRQACRVRSRTVSSSQSIARDSNAIIMRIKEITQTRVLYGYRRVHVMLRREGWRDNHKRVYRLYREQGLSLQHKRTRRIKAARLRQPKQIVIAINEIWSMGFSMVHDRRLRGAHRVFDQKTLCAQQPAGCQRGGGHTFLYQPAYRPDVGLIDPANAIRPVNVPFPEHGGRPTPSQPHPLAWKREPCKIGGPSCTLSDRRIMKKAKQRRRDSLPPAETPEQLRVRLRAFVLATREDAMRPVNVPFPEHVTVLAGPLRRNRTR